MLQRGDQCVELRRQPNPWLQTQKGRHLRAALFTVDDDRLRKNSCQRSRYNRLASYCLLTVMLFRMNDCRVWIDASVAASSVGSDAVSAASPLLRLVSMVRLKLSRDFTTELW